MNIIPKNPATNIKANPTPAPKLPEDRAQQLAKCLALRTRQRNPVDRFVDKWFGPGLVLGFLAICGCAIFTAVKNDPLRKETEATSPADPVDEEPLIVEPLPDLPSDKQETEEGVWIEIPVEPQTPTPQPQEQNQEPPKPIEKPSQEPKQDKPDTEYEFVEPAYASLKAGLQTPPSRTAPHSQISL